VETVTHATHPSAFLVAGLALGGGLLAVSVRNILHAIFGLAIAIFGIAILFVYLGSPFLAAMQVLIYIGGISVAMVFAVMFSYEAQFRPERAGRFTGALVPSLAFLAFVWTTLRSLPATAPAPGRDWTLHTVGRLLLTDYAPIFEALSIVLLLAIIGAILIATRSADS
jgi:NADH-quinone oxidoreductase subunit J